MTVVNLGKAQQNDVYEGEVILFKQPSEECCLFVGGLAPDVTTEELYESFSKYGLINSCQIIADTDVNLFYAFVRYYSVYDAREAKRNLNRYKFRGVACKIEFKRRRALPASAEYTDLPIQCCIELLSHFIGFDQYSTTILSLTQLSFEQTPEGLYRCEYRAVVRLTFKKDGRKVDGIGSAQKDGWNKGEVLDFCKKIAVTEARKSAFSLLAIVRLPDGKTTLHFIQNGLDDWRERHVSAPEVVMPDDA
eukprot:TRINITY_DN14922_c0_g1_i1.p1 TRINITY_DN14922_c0_g1~~TRINITY_DN14922_c0_g1_i1.p1  ORF type:complete len:249 (-),score=43.08 TRINITY_DN14922_c0_g1_i1:97-843(-)